VREKPEDLYLNLLKNTLSFNLWPEPPVPVESQNYLRAPWKRTIISFLARILKLKNLGLVQYVSPTEEERAEGKVWPGYADTMIGLKRLDNLLQCCRDVVEKKIQGDFIETGVWRGGSCILMRAVLAAYRDTGRKVFVADSFAGLPPPDEDNYEADAGDVHHQMDFLAVSEEQVRRNFERYGLLDEQVVFLKGWFKDTLPTAPIDDLAILRLDGDMYESTMTALDALYDKLSPGGYCIVDDYGLRGCKQAIDDFRKTHSIPDQLISVDWTGVYWQKNS